MNYQRSSNISIIKSVLKRAWESDTFLVILGIAIVMVFYQAGIIWLEKRG